MLVKKWFDYLIKLFWNFFWIKNELIESLLQIDKNYIDLFVGNITGVPEFVLIHLKNFLRIIIQSFWALLFKLNQISIIFIWNLIFRNKQQLKWVIPLYKIFMDEFFQYLMVIFIHIFLHFNIFILMLYFLEIFHVH